VDARLHHPVYSFGRFVSKIVAAEIDAKEENEADIVAIGCLELMDLRRLLFAPLVCVREITRRFRFNQNRQAFPTRFLWLDDYIDRDIDLPSRSNRQVHAKGVRASLHFVEWL